MHEAERVNATRIKQPFGRVQALVSTAKELGEGPTQTGSTSLRPKALEEPEEMEASLEVDTPLSGAHSLRAESGLVCRETHFYARCASTLMPSFSVLEVNPSDDRGEEQVQSRVNVYECKDILIELKYNNRSFFFII